MTFGDLDPNGVAGLDGDIHVSSLQGIFSSLLDHQSSSQDDL